MVQLEIRTERIPLVEQIVNAIMLEQRWLDRNWLEEQVSKSRITSSALLVYTEMIEVLEHTYPDNWSFMVKLTKGERGLTIILDPVIRFERTLITNSNDDLYTIRELFVRLWMTPGMHNDIVMGDIQGCRFHFCYKSFMRGYSHSHLQSQGTNALQKVISWQSFCLGSGEISMTYAELRDNFDRDKFQMLLFQIPILLEWESLDGVPYMKISALESPLPTNATMHNTQYADATLVKKLVSIAKRHWIETNKQVIVYQEIPQLGFILNSKDLVVIVDDESLEKWFLFRGKPDTLEELLALYMNEDERESNFTINEMRNLFCVRYSNSDYVYTTTPSSFGIDITPVVEDSASIIFRGENFKRVVDPPPATIETEEMKLNFTIAKTILNEARRKLEENLNYNKIKNSAVKHIS